ncbi:MAG: DUF29 family protein, partial [Cyanobacteria bacterium J06607_13]
DKAYARAVVLASSETGVEFDIFPTDCPYKLVQALDLDFLPE